MENDLRVREISVMFTLKVCEEWSIYWLPAITSFPTMVSKVILYRGVKEISIWERLGSTCIY